MSVHEWYDPIVEVCPIEVLGKTRWKWRLVFPNGHAVISQGYPLDSKMSAITAANSYVDAMVGDLEASNSVYGEWERVG